LLALLEFLVLACFLFHEVTIFVFVNLSNQVVFLFSELTFTFLQVLMHTCKFCLALFQLVLVSALNALYQGVMALLPLLPFRLVATVEVGHRLFKLDVGVVEILRQFVLKVL